MAVLPRLTRRLLLEERQGAPDGGGGYGESWVVLGTLAAEVTPRSVGRELSAGRTTARMGFRIVVRAAAEGSPARPRAGQRLRAGARIWDVLAVSEADAEGRYLRIEAEERQ
ncbi:MAG: phage head closure protein [Pseudomonadota bacterium]